MELVTGYFTASSGTRAVSSHLCKSHVRLLLSYSPRPTRSDILLSTPPYIASKAASYGAANSVHLHLCHRLVLVLGEVGQGPR